MSAATVQDWTESQVLLTFDNHYEVKYRVYRDGDRHFQEIRELDGAPIHTLELPPGMKLEKSSYEVLLRFVLLEIVVT